MPVAQSWPNVVPAMALLASRIATSIFAVRPLIPTRLQEANKKVPRNVGQVMARGIRRASRSNGRR